MGPSGHSISQFSHQFFTDTRDAQEARTHLAVENEPPEQLRPRRVASWRVTVPPPVGAGLLRERQLDERLHGGHAVRRLRAREQPPDQIRARPIRRPHLKRASSYVKGQSTYGAYRRSK
eukprot:1189211-Prorocentrum_minimum.AAC.3